MNCKRNIVTLIESFFVTWALSKVFLLNPGNIFNGVIFVIGILIINHIKSIIDDDVRTIRIAHITSLIFTVCIMLYGRDSYIGELTNRFFRLIILCSVFIGLFTGFYYMLRYLYHVFSCPKIWGYLRRSEDDKEPENKLVRFYVNHIQISTFLICVICFLPYFLYQFPGIMTPDSIVQYEQALHITEYSNHHPWIHTLILELFYNIGHLFTNDDTVAASGYTLVQMCFMAYCGAYVTETLSRLKVRKGICLAVTLFYGLVPYNAVFAITVWKDVPFAGIVALFVCTLIRFDIYLNSDERSKSQSVVYIILVGLLAFCLGLFRSNGLYALIALIPFLAVHYKKYIKVMLTTTVILLVFIFLFKGPLMKAFNVKGPDTVESLSIPLQQVANVIVNDREISDGYMKEIRNVVDLTYIKELYEPTFADNIKELVRAGNEEYLVNNKWAFTKMYIHLGLQYPADYMKAYVMQTYGYFYPDRDYNVADTEGVVNSNIDFKNTPIIAGPVVVKAKEILIKLGNMIPVYSLLWSMGTIFFVLIFVISLNRVRNRKNRNLYLLPYLLIMLTILIATPVATEFRYGYFMMFSIPVILFGACGEDVK